MEFTEQGPVKFSVLIIRSLWTDIRDADFLYMCKESRKETVLVDDLFQQQISTSMLEINTSVSRKEGRAEISLVN